jgi:hypothetical protein
MMIYVLMFSYGYPPQVLWARVCKYGLQERCLSNCCDTVYHLLLTRCCELEQHCKYPSRMLLVDLFKMCSYFNLNARTNSQVKTRSLPLTSPRRLSTRTKSNACSEIRILVDGTFHRDGNQTIGRGIFEICRETFEAVPAKH